MTPAELKESFDACRRTISAYYAHAAMELPEELKSVSHAEYFRTVHPFNSIRHLKFMCEKGKQLADLNQDKANRWLGFVQGALWMTGMASITEMRQWNMPKKYVEDIIAEQLSLQTDREVFAPRCGFTTCTQPAAPGDTLCSDHRELVAVANMEGVTKMGLCSKEECRGIEVSPGMWSGCKAKETGAGDCPTCGKKG